MTDGTREISAGSPQGTTPLRPGVLRSIFGVIADRQAWGGLGYMLLSLLTGVFYFSWVVTGLSLSLGLSVVIFGLPVFVAFVASVRVLSRLERTLVETLLEATTAPRDPSPVDRVGPSTGLLDRVKGWLLDGRTWASMLYFLLELPVGVVCFSLFTTLLALSVSLFLAPMFQWVTGLPVVWIGHERFWLPLWAAPFVSLAGVAFLLLSLHLARAFGRVQAAVAGQMLVREG